MQRLAERVDSTTSVREISAFVEVGETELFMVQTRPISTPRAGVIFCSPILAEHLKTYRLEVLAARAFAAQGFATVRFHYRGFGQSGGMMDTATIATMLDDVRAVVDQFQEEAGVPLVFAGMRWGALVAGLSASEHIGAPLLLWEPTVDGEQFFRDVFRASQMSMLARGGASTLSVEEAIGALREQGVVDALGHPVYLSLFESAAASRLVEAARHGPRPVLLLQMSRGSVLRPDVAAVVAAFEAGGSPVDVVHVPGEGAWAFVDRPIQSPGAFTEASLAWLSKTFPGPL